MCGRDGIRGGSEEGCGIDNVAEDDAYLYQILHDVDITGDNRRNQYQY